MVNIKYEQIYIYFFSRTCLQRKTAVPNHRGSTDLKTEVGILDRDPGAVVLTSMFRISTPPSNHYKINVRVNRSPPCEFLSLEPCATKSVCAFEQSGWAVYISYYNTFDRPVEDVVLTSVSCARSTPAETLRVLWGGTLLVEHLNHGTCVTGKELTAERKSPLRTNHCWCQLPAQSVTKTTDI